MKSIVAICSLLLLAGCQTKTLSELSYSELKDVGAKLAQKCTDQGYGPTSPERDACMKQEIAREDATRRTEKTKQNSAMFCQRIGYTTVCG